jgi:hypothetical protein
MEASQLLDLRADRTGFANQVRNTERKLVKREKKRIRGEGFSGGSCLEYLSCESFSELDPAVLALEEPD